MRENPPEVFAEPLKRVRALENRGGVCFSKSGGDMQVPKAIFLDVGWTLIYPRSSLWEMLAQTVTEAGLRLKAEEAERAVHTLMWENRAAALAEFENGAQYSDSDEEFAKMFTSLGRIVFGMVGISEEPHLMQRFADLFWNAENWTVFSDVSDCLERLRRRGVRLGVLSNASSELGGFLAQLDLLQHFDFTVVSAVEGIKKPDRRIFEVALQRAGVRSDEAVHVGDMYLEDVVGARKVGVRPLLMDRGRQGMFPNHPESANHPHGAVETVRDLPETLVAVGLAE